MVVGLLLGLQDRGFQTFLVVRVLQFRIPSVDLVLPCLRILLLQVGRQVQEGTVAACGHVELLGEDMVETGRAVWERFLVVQRREQVLEILRSYPALLHKVHELGRSVSTLSVVLEGVAHAQGPVVGHIQPATVTDVTAGPCDRLLLGEDL